MDTENDSFYEHSNVSSTNSSSGSNNSSSSNLLMNLPMLPILHAHGDDDDDDNDNGGAEDEQPDLSTLTAGIVESDGMNVSANVSTSNAITPITNIVTNNIHNISQLNAHNFLLIDHQASSVSSSSSTPATARQSQSQMQTQSSSTTSLQYNYSSMHPPILESSTSTNQTQSQPQFQSQTDIFINETINTHLHQEHFSPTPPFHQQHEISLQSIEHGDIHNDNNLNEAVRDNSEPTSTRETLSREAQLQLNPGDDFVGIEDVADDDTLPDRQIVDNDNRINQTIASTSGQVQQQRHSIIGASSSATTTSCNITTLPLLEVTSKNNNYATVLTAGGFRPTQLQLQDAHLFSKFQVPSLGRIFNFDRNGHLTNMYAQGDGPHSSGIVASKSGGQHPVIDRLKLLYPNVNEQETPLPRCWSAQDKCLSIGLSQNNLRVHYKGAGKQNNDAASVRTAYPIPPACGLYYFEVKIISKGKNGYMGIGLTAQTFRMNRLPGWDKQSYGYHGDDGNSFSSSGNGQPYGPTFTTGDVIGCCVNFVNNTCFYTKNGIDLGIAFRDLPSKLYPTVGLQTPGEEVDANFGQEPFKFDQIEDMMKQMREEMKASIYGFPIMPNLGDPTILLHKMVASYLVHNGYSQTAEAFAKSTGQTCAEEMSSIRNRQKIIKLAMSGKMGNAIEQTLRSYPGLLESNKNLWFMLKCRQFIEMINGSDIDQYCPSNSNSKTNYITTTTTQTQTTPAPPNQTSVIQSTKSYQNGKQTTTNSTAVINSDNNLLEQQNQQDLKIAILTSGNDANDCNTNNAIDSFFISNKNGTCGATSSKAEYQNDIEMENNGHTANGGACKNGDGSIFATSLDIDEEMDVDTLPSARKYGDVIERILEFGKELSQMGQQLEKDNKMTEEERQMLEDAFSLIAYSNPWSSPLGWQLCPTRRENVCTALNSAILESLNYSRRPPLDICVAHASELLKVMAQSSLGASAFVNIEDVFPQN